MHPVRRACIMCVTHASPAVAAAAMCVGQRGGRALHITPTSASRRVAPTPHRAAHRRVRFYRLTVRRCDLEVASRQVEILRKGAALRLAHAPRVVPPLPCACFWRWSHGPSTYAPLCIHTCTPLHVHMHPSLPHAHAPLYTCICTPLHMHMRPSTHAHAPLCMCTCTPLPHAHAPLCMYICAPLHMHMHPSACTHAPLCCACRLSSLGSSS
jgi:hypothetical protein